MKYKIGDIYTWQDRYDPFIITKITNFGMIVVVFLRDMRYTYAYSIFYLDNTAILMQKGNNDEKV